MLANRTERRPTLSLAWVALAVACASIVYAPMLLGNKSSNILIKLEALTGQSLTTEVKVLKRSEHASSGWGEAPLGLISSIPVATSVALIYAISVAMLANKIEGRVSKPIAATIVVGVLGLILDAGAWVVAFNRHGP